MSHTIFYRRGDSTSDADDEASVVTRATPRRSRMIKSRSRSPPKSRKNSITSIGGDIPRRVRQGSNASSQMSGTHVLSL